MARTGVKVDGLTWNAYSWNLPDLGVRELEVLRRGRERRIPQSPFLAADALALQFDGLLLVSI
jgi:hypothetical protein